MTCSVAYSADDRLITITYHGAVTSAIIQACIAEAAALATQHHCYRVLSDMRAATLAMSTIAVYTSAEDVARQFSATGLSERQFRRAIVFAADSQAYLFYETVSHNRGQHVNIFKDMDEARNWLKAGQ